MNKKQKEKCELSNKKINYLYETENNISNYELFKELEETLDDQFPKGKCKERGHALVLFTLAYKKIKELIKQKDEYKKKIIDWCYKNNTTPMKDLYKNMSDSNLRLCTTDRGWINLLKFEKFLDTI